MATKPQAIARPAPRLTWRVPDEAAVKGNQDARPVNPVKAGHRRMCGVPAAQMSVFGGRVLELSGNDTSRPAQAATMDQNSDCVDQEYCLGCRHDLRIELFVDVSLQRYRATNVDT